MSIDVSAIELLAWLGTCFFSEIFVRYNIVSSSIDDVNEILCVKLYFRANCGTSVLSLLPNFALSNNMNAVSRLLKSQPSYSTRNNNLIIS